MTRGSDIKAVGQEGKRIRTEHLEIRVVASPLAHPRVGVVVPRHRHSAVDRNRLKRRLREIVRTEVLPVLAVVGRGVDLVIRTRERAYDAPFAGLRAELAASLPRIQRLMEPASEPGT